MLEVGVGQSGWAEGTSDAPGTVGGGGAGIYGGGSGGGATTVTTVGRFAKAGGGGGGIAGAAGGSGGGLVAQDGSCLIVSVAAVVRLVYCVCDFSRYYVACITHIPFVVWHYCDISMTFVWHYCDGNMIFICHMYNICVVLVLSLLDAPPARLRRVSRRYGGPRRGWHADSWGYKRSIHSRSLQLVRRHGWLAVYRGECMWGVQTNRGGRRRGR